MSEGREAGRGTAAIALAKIYFVLAGFGVQFALPRALGSPERFGAYSSALVAVSILNNVLIAATVQTVSKLVSEDEARSPATLRRALGLQLGLGLLLAGGLAIAPGLTGVHASDLEQRNLLRIAALIVLAYSVYAALVGALNGQRRFVAQASFDAGFTTLRTTALLVGAATFGVTGAIGGFAAAALGITLASLLVVGVGRAGDAPSYRRFAAFMMPIWLYQGCLNALMQLDVLVLRRTLTTFALEAGETVERAVELANESVGLYRAAQNFAFVPYQLVLTATLVVFPMVSRATASGDDDAARRAIGSAGRFSWLALLAMVAPMVGASSGVMRIVYKPEYVAGSGALAILAVGLLAFTLFVLAATVLAGAGRPTVAFAIAGASAALMVVLVRLALASAGHGAGIFVAVASGTSLAMAFAAAVAIALVLKRFGTFVPIASVVRGLVAAVAAGSVAHAIPHARPLLAIAALAGGVVTYAIGLAALGELRDVFAALRARRATPGG